jgi:hypothetical protein
MKINTDVLSEILIDAKLDSRNGYSKTQHVQQSQHLTDSDQLFPTSPTLMTSHVVDLSTPLHVL